MTTLSQLGVHVLLNKTLIAPVCVQEPGCQPCKLSVTRKMGFGFPVKIKKQDRVSLDCKVNVLYN